MLIPIEKITVQDRIRKEFGNIEELAQDIAENGLINPPVVTPEYKLIAGERRLRACKHLGYAQIEVRVMSVKDYEHMLNLEINENESRKEFTKIERLEYARRLEKIERMKAKERMEAGGVENFPQGAEGKTRDIVAEKLGIGSGKQYEKEKFIAENADTETLEAWNNGDISTHKAYVQLKEEMEAAERRAQQAESERHKLEQRAIKAEGQAEWAERKISELEGKEPETVYIDKPYIPDEMKARLQELEERAGDLDKAKMEVSEYNSKKRKIENEMHSLMENMRKLQESYDKENENLTKQAFIINKISMATKPLKQAKGEIEQALKQASAMSEFGRAKIVSEVDFLYEMATMIDNKINEIKAEVLYYESNDN